MGNFGPGHLRQDVNEESVTVAPERQQNSSNEDDDDCPLAELAKKKEGIRTEYKIPSQQMEM